jgi:MFS family permease
MASALPVARVSEHSLNWRVLGPVFAVVSIDAMGMGVILPLLPFYAQRYGATPLVIGALFASFALCQFIAGPVLGSLSDRTGRKPILIASQIGTCLSFVIPAVANSLPLLFLARILDGATSGNLSVASAYAIDHSTPATRKRSIGVVSAGVGIGVIVGPALNTASAHLSPTAPIWIAAAMSATSVIVSILMLPKASKSTNKKIAAAPVSGAVSLTPSIAILAVMLLYYLAFGAVVGGLAIFLAARFSLRGHPFGPAEIGIVFTGIGVINIVVQLCLLKWFERLSQTSFLAF